MELIEFIESENVAFFFFLYFGAAGKRTQPVQRVSLAPFSYFPAQRANGLNRSVLRHELFCNRAFCILKIKVILYIFLRFEPETCAFSRLPIGGNLKPGTLNLYPDSA
jgi:hypothetical protein